MDVTANQEEIENTETFQLEAEAGSGRWYIRTMQDRYFTLQPGGGVQAADKVRTQQALFDLEWQEDGSVCIKGSNGNSVLYNFIFLRDSQLQVNISATRSPGTCSPTATASQTTRGTSSTWSTDPSSC